MGIPVAVGPGRGSTARYAAAVVTLVGAVASQYVLPPLVPASRVVYGNLAGGLLVVYGLPVLAFAALVGSAPLAGWRGQFPTASLQGLRWYGTLSLLALVLAIALFVILTALGVNVVNALSRQTPVIQAAAPDPWFWVGLSFVIGAVEELLFRGWVYGFWRGAPRWGGAPALAGTSALFAGVHAYYLTTYGAVALASFLGLFLLGLGFALTVRASGGNLVVVALIHGANDATAFVTLVSLSVGVALHYTLVLVGALIALLLWLRSRSADRPLSPIAPLS